MGPPDPTKTPKNGAGGVSPDQASEAAKKGTEITPPPPVTHQCPVPPKTWVEFCLVDMEGNPAEGRRYKVKLTDGSIKEGALGKTGCVRFDNIPPGTASICFVDLDQDVWERI